jgi:glycosyltransferase involved in cell wall biosynthesis
MNSEILTGDPSDQQFHLLSFEGPDPYSAAGGIASRVTGLGHALASRGFDTHLWFIGDPDKPGHEEIAERLTVHRWCQWISRWHPLGAYDGESSKVSDYSVSLAPYLIREVLGPKLRAAGSAVVIAEEWQTAGAVVDLDRLLRAQGLRTLVKLLWNANNTFGFDRIEWGRLAEAATITTVSRYMKHLMWQHGVDPLVIPNGLSAEAFARPDARVVTKLRRQFAGRPILAKVARFDPDKRWMLAVDTVVELKKRGSRPLLIARGGVESHGSDVFRAAGEKGLRIAECAAERSGAEGLLAALANADGADIVSLRTHIDPEARLSLFRAADAVLANSGREPFGLVGLETMAVGGVACTGCTGEDYAIAGKNALVLQTADPSEFVRLYERLQASPVHAHALRRNAKATAKSFAWPEVIERHLLPGLELPVP